MNKTLGAPSLARSGSGQAGLETSNVRPMTPGNAVPTLYSLSDTLVCPFEMRPNALTWSLIDDDDRRLVDVQFLDATCRNAAGENALTGWPCHIGHIGLRES